MYFIYYNLFFSDGSAIPVDALGKVKFTEYFDPFCNMFTIKY